MDPLLTLRFQLTSGIPPTACFADLVDGSKFCSFSHWLLIANFNLTTEIEFENMFYTLKNLNSYLEQLKLMNLNSNECIPIIYISYCVFDLGICAEDEDFEDALSLILSLKEVATLTAG